MMKKILIIITLLVKVEGLFAQNSDLNKNGLLISIGGEGGIYTLGYEHRFGYNKTIHPFLHTGFSAFPIDQRITFAFPVSSGIIYNKNKFNFLVGAGIGPNVSYYYQQFSSGTSPSRFRYYSRGFLETGIRYYFKMDKYSIGLRYTPFVSFIENFQFEHWGAITLGIHLKSKKQ